MPTRALAIRDAVLTALRASAVAGVPASRIYADPQDAISTRPAIIVELGAESQPAKEYSKRRRAISLNLRIIADGADPYAAIDPIRIAAHARLMTDKTLGGKAEMIEEGESRREFADMDMLIGSLATTYTVQYQTSLDSLE
jgi:hypothetical protein